MAMGVSELSWILLRQYGLMVVMACLGTPNPLYHGPNDYDVTKYGGPLPKAGLG